MSALHVGLDLGEAMAWGTVQAANVVSALGANRGLAPSSRLKTAVQAHPELIATEF